MVLLALIWGDKLPTGAEACTQTARGQILSHGIKEKAFRLARIRPCCREEFAGGGARWHEREEGGIFLFPSYLEYLKPVDVEHAHDLVAGLSLSLQGER